ncbi:hypothetical protein L2K20_10400 [Mycobacterium sp. MBM]|nr:hypothetical protein [Mycobacterium sp. MBM]
MTDGIAPEQQDGPEQQDDYDLLTHIEAGRRLTEDIDDTRKRCAQAEGREAERYRARLADLEDAARRHREWRPADVPTFFSASGSVERVSTGANRRTPNQDEEDSPLTPNKPEW